MLKYFIKYADNRDTNSMAHQFRIKRFSLFIKLFENIIYSGRKVTILDVGGTEIFWHNMEIDKYPNLHILLLNLTKEKTSKKNIDSISGDACDLSIFENKQFDIVFSNSVIEHVGDFKRQQSMANEIQRVGKNYFLQTPNYYFPIEPHFLFIGFHWLPMSFRAFLINHFSIGWIKKIPDNKEALKFVNDIRLIRFRELKYFFPNATILREKYFGLTKSFIVYAINEN